LEDRRISIWITAAPQNFVCWTTLGEEQTMPSLFERAFFQAVRKRRIHHPTRLKTTIRSFHQAYSKNYPETASSIETSTRFENEHSTNLQQGTENGETMVSEDMARLLMKKGFSSIPKCTAN
jgi:hypothetical protein